MELKQSRRIVPALGNTEASMNIRSLTTAAGAAFLVSTGLAFAQAVVEFTPEQEQEVYTTITRERIRTAPPAEFRARVGIEVPRSVELYEVPSSIEIAPVRRYRYMIIEDEVVLVDPGTRRVVRIIRQR
jgi:hypothetical protein